MRKHHTSPLHPIVKALLPYFPDLERKLEIADINQDPHDFLEHTIKNSLIFSVVVTIIIGVFFFFFKLNLIFIIPIFLFFLLFNFYTSIHLPDIIILRKKREIEYDLVYAIRQLIIEVSSGVPLFDALVSLTRDYGSLSNEIKRIVERATVGDPLAEVLREEADRSPSLILRRVLLQLANDTISGADISESLSYLIDQIVKQQIIEVKEYGNKLNPLVMFYLVIGVIFPTLGITFIIILLSLVASGFSIPFSYLILFAFVIGLFQLMFLTFIESSRPRYAMLV